MIAAAVLVAGLPAAAPTPEQTATAEVDDVRAALVAGGEACELIEPALSRPGDVAATPDVLCLEHPHSPADAGSSAQL